MATPVDRLASLLIALGYRADTRNPSFIMSGVGGLKVGVYLIEDLEIQIRCLFLKAENNFQLELINQYNSRYRFAKAFLDGDGDCMLTMDYRFSPDTEGASEQLEEIMEKYAYFLDKFLVEAGLRETY